MLGQCLGSPGPLTTLGRSARRSKLECDTCLAGGALRTTSPFFFSETHARAHNLVDRTPHVIRTAQSILPLLHPLCSAAAVLLCTVCLTLSLACEVCVWFSFAAVLNSWPMNSRCGHKMVTLPNQNPPRDSRNRLSLNSHVAYSPS